MIRVHAGDLEAVGWNGGAIELLLVDAMKSWPLARCIVKDFYPSMIPGRSVVLHQDFKHYFTYWIHLVQFRHRSSFRLERDIPDCGSTAFRMTDAINPVVTLPEDLADISQEEWDEAFNHSIGTVGGKPSNIAAAHVMQLIQSGRRDQSCAVFDGYLERGYPLVSDLIFCREILNRA